MRYVEYKAEAKLLARTKGESPRTTKLYDRTSDEITLSEVEKISI